MRTQALVTVLAAAAAVVAENAPVVKHNPIGGQYEASIKSKTVSGSIKISSGVNGKGSHVEIAVSGLPSEGGPFMYHIHEKAVPEDGNCTSTGAHLDPYKAGETPLCDAKKPETCQTGDLSGKHGNMTSGTTFSAVYDDEYLALDDDDKSFFGDKSIVIHLSNKTRIACANFKGNAVVTTSASASTGTGLPSGTPHGGHNSSSTAKPTGESSGSPIQPTASPTATNTPGEGAAGKVAMSGAALFAFAAAWML